MSDLQFIDDGIATVKPHTFDTLQIRIDKSVKGFAAWGTTPTGEKYRFLSIDDERLREFLERVWLGSNWVERAELGRVLRSMGVPQVIIADFLGVSQATVSKDRRRT